MQWTGGVVIFGALVAIFLSARAVWKARRAERLAVADAERAKRLKNEFVSMVSHELRTPLTSIAGFSQTLRDSWRDLPTEEIDEFLSIITKQAQHLSELVEDVLVLPRLEAGRLKINAEVVELLEMLHEVTDMLFPTAAGKEAAVGIPAGVTVYVDRRRAQQVLRNLLENARKYGGDQILVEGLPLGHQYMVVVADNGPGVPEDETERIFGHFEQLTAGDARSESGIGLGLPIARQLARAMGGDVWYEPRFPTGSRFCFTMPAGPPGSPLGNRQDDTSEQIPSM